jgi:hypothetical protein
MLHSPIWQFLAQVGSGSSSGGGGAFVIIPILILFGLAIFAFWLWSLIHCAMNRRLSDSNRVVGIVLIVFLGPLGSLIYLFLPRGT